MEGQHFNLMQKTLQQMAGTNLAIYSLVTNFSLLPKHASSVHPTAFKKTEEKRVTYSSHTT